MALILWCNGGAIFGPPGGIPTFLQLATDWVQVSPLQAYPGIGPPCSEAVSLSYSGVQNSTETLRYSKWLGGSKEQIENVSLGAIWMVEELEPFLGNQKWFSKNRTPKSLKK